MIDWFGSWGREKRRISGVEDLVIIRLIAIEFVGKFREYHSKSSLQSFDFSSQIYLYKRMDKNRRREIKHFLHLNVGT